MKLIFFSHANRIKRVGKIDDCDDRECKISPRRGDGNDTRTTASFFATEWKISPRLGDGKTIGVIVWIIVSAEWKTSPQRGDGNLISPTSKNFSDTMNGR